MPRRKHTPAGAPAASSRRRRVVEQPSLFGLSRGIDLRTHKCVRVAAAGDVTLDRLETSIVDTPDFQRLRRIRQLGTAWLVYPTALHTRFDHSLGVLGMTLEMIRAIRENPNLSDDERRIDPDREQLARLLALLHDIGHAPFGHTLEDEFSLMPRHDRDPARVDRFAGPGSEIGRRVRASAGVEMHDRLLRLMTAEGPALEAAGDERFLHDLVNDAVCADLLDYLRRDSFFCGITLDLDYRFLRYLTLRRTAGARRAVVRLWAAGAPGPRRDVASELIRLLDDRYLMGERVYFHHAKLTSGAMIAGAVARAMRDGLAPEAIHELGDDALVDRLADAADPNAPAARLARALRERRLWKAVARIGREEIEGEGPRFEAARRRAELWHRDPRARMEAEDRLATTCGGEPGDALIHCPARGMSLKPADTLVEWRGEVRPLRACDEDPIIGPKLATILESHRNLWAVRLCAAPGRIPRETAEAALRDELFAVP